MVTLAKSAERLIIFNIKVMKLIQLFCYVRRRNKELEVWRKSLMFEEKSMIIVHTNVDEAM